MRKNIKVSIIIPVYNVPEKCLKKCIESAINQTIKEIEIIIVDDGSTDHSGDVCDYYAKHDSRVHVIHKKNNGLSSARNTGFRAANGEWITFLDADDWIDSKTCESTFNFGVQNELDIVIFKAVQEFGNYKKNLSYDISGNSVFYGEECEWLQEEVLRFDANIATAWGKLINRSFLNSCNVEHNERLKQGSEGIEFNIRLFNVVRKVGFYDEILYHYIYNPNSISSKHDVRNHKFVIKCFEKIREEIATYRNSEKLLELLYIRFAYVIIATAISGYFSPQNAESYFKKRRSFEKYRKSYLVRATFYRVNSKTFDFKRRVAFFFIKNRLYLMVNLMAKIRKLKKR